MLRTNLVSASNIVLKLRVLIWRGVLNLASEKAFPYCSLQSYNGIASGQRVNLSIIINKYLKSLGRGRGPTMWIYSNRVSGADILINNV